MRENIFEDWQAQGITSVLHEKKGGYGNQMRSLYRLADKAEAEGVRILTGVEVTGFTMDKDSITAVETSKGNIQCDWVIAGPGPWAKGLWDMLELPSHIDIMGPDGVVHPGNQMWTYWCLVEGTLGVDPDYAMNNQGKMPPVIHVDSQAPLYSSEDGSLITEEMWGIYYKPDFNFGGVQGGAAPYIVEGDVKVDPYGIDSPDFTVTPEFVHMWTSALAHCQKRYEDKYQLYKNEPSGGLGCFTPDSFPIFDTMKQNCYMILDSNHGYKMIGVGALVAKEILGEKQTSWSLFVLTAIKRASCTRFPTAPFPGAEKERVCGTFFGRCQEMLAEMESRGLFCCRILDAPSLTVERTFYAGTRIPQGLQSSFPCRHKRAGCSIGIRCVSKKDLAT